MLQFARDDARVDRLGGPSQRPSQVFDFRLVLVHECGNETILLVADVALLLYPFAPGFFQLVLERGDLRLALFTTIATFGTPHDVTLQELRLETLFAVDQATEEALRRLAG